MAISVFPELMDRLDPEDVDSSLRTLESYIHYIVERVEFSLTNNFKTVNNLGVTGETLSLALSEAINDLSALESTVADVETDVQGKVDKVPGKGLSTNDYTDEDKAALANKVDKEAGKGLSENDYTDADKAKLAGVEAGAQVNVIETVKQNGTALPVTGKAVDVTVPTKASDLTNDSGYQTAQQVQAAVTAGLEPLLVAEIYGPARVVAFEAENAGLPTKRLLADIEAVQAGSGIPSPSNVRPIQGWAGAKVTRTGENLFGGRGFVDAAANAAVSGVTGSGDTVTIRAGSLPALLSTIYTGKFKENTAYTFFLTGANERTGSSPVSNLAFLYTDGTRSGTLTCSNKARNVSDATKTLLGIGALNNTGVAVLTASQCGLFEGNIYAEEFVSYDGADHSVSWQTEAGTVYGGTVDVVSGVLTVTHGQIASYAGETLPGAWISDRDVYAPGTSPSTGAQVVYELASPLTYQVTPHAVTALAGANNIWADCGDVTVEYGAFLAALQAEIDGLDNRETAIEAVLTNAGPILYENVQDVYVETGQTSVMSVKALGAVTYKWEHFWNSWTQPNWEGKDTDTLHIPAATSQMNLRQVRCTITGSGWTIYSRVAYVHVT